jgi:glycerophosphoryl diester phosphodiesterase
LLHDPFMVRTTRWPLPVRAVPSALVTRARLRGGQGETVPSLERALAALPPRLGTAIDVKDASAIAIVLDVVAAGGFGERVLLWSQHAKAIRVARERCPQVEAALLRDTASAGATARYLDDALAIGAKAVSLHQGVLTREVVADAQARGLTVYCWIQSRGGIASAVATGLDGIVTDWPRDARSVIDGIAGTE